MTIASGADAARAATLILAAWRDPAHPLADLPPELRPDDLAQAYAVQQAVMSALGAIGGWKVGAPGPAAPPTCAPMPLDGIHIAPARLSAATFTLRGVEAEICFRLGRDLPAHWAPYTREQVIAAIDTCHPAIEVLQSRFVNPDALNPMTQLADFSSHGCFVVGEQFDGWQQAEFAQERVRLLLGGKEALARTGNPAGDMIRLVQWLANEGAHWAGGLLTGQYITTGSWTGKTYVPVGVRVEAAFATAGSAVLDFV